jgi:GT2 family glycosyltransferase
MGSSYGAKRQKLAETPTAAVIVAVWNRADITARFLTQLKPYLGEIHELIMVDDCSTDRTPEVLEWWRDRLKGKMRTPRNPQNQGYGPSCNRGARFATSDIVVFMNNDIDIRGSFVAPTIQKLVEEPRSLVTVNLVDWDGGWNKWDGKVVPYAEGWYLAAWKETWDELGGFDERFVPCDYEDVDLSYRAIQADFQLIPLNLPLVHIGGISANQREREKITLKNRRLFGEKWGFKLESET